MPPRAHGLASCKLDPEEQPEPRRARRKSMGSRTIRKGKAGGSATTAPARSRGQSARASESTTRPLPDRPALEAASPRAQPSGTRRKLPIRSSPVTTAPSLRSRPTPLQKKPAAPKARAPVATGARDPPPFAPKLLLQELEPRLLMSADLNPLATDAL